MLTQALVLSALLFAIGTFGVLVRRNAIIMFLCIELQLNAVNLALVAFSRVGLAIIISIFRHYETVNVNSFNLLKW